MASPGEMLRSVPWRLLLGFVIFVLVFSSLVPIVQSHSHDDIHMHEHEPPSYKYSKEANVPHVHSEGERKKGSPATGSHSHHGEHHPHHHGEHHSHHHEEHPHHHEEHHPHHHEEHHPHHHEEHHPHHHEEHHSHHHEEHHSHNSHRPKVMSQRPSGSMLWLQAIGSTLVISIAPFFILFFIPLDNTKSSEPLLKILLSFASGGLLGDAFLHLIPHALMHKAETDSSHHHEDGHHHFHSHGHTHAHDESAHGDHHHVHDMSVGLWVLAGILAFLMVEKFVRIMKEKTPGSHHHHHHHHIEPKAKEREASSRDSSPSAAKDQHKGQGDEKKNENQDSEKEEEQPKEEKIEEEPKEEKEEVSNPPSPSSEDIKVAGYLNLAADFTHNFTDGLAIGASFLAGQSIGIVTTITVLLHEIPHEIGDFAILIQSGCSRYKAMLLQLVTAIGALAGTFTSLFAESIGNAAPAWILPFTAGGFIYIATVSVIPELLEDTKLSQSIKEIAALLVGVYMMVLIAEYE